MNYKSDHYELKIYKYAPEKMAYRNESIGQPAFYEKGTSYEQREFFYKILQSLNNNPSDLVIDLEDVSDAADNITTQFIHCKSDKLPRFWITSLRMSEHATTLVSVLDPMTQRPLVVLFINSQPQEENYFQKIKQHFFTERMIPNYSLTINDKIFQLTLIFFYNLIYL